MSLEEPPGVPYPERSDTGGPLGLPRLPAVAELAGAHRDSREGKTVQGHAMKLRDVFTVVNRMQADGIIDRYALGGAVAATFYLEPVSTIHVDIFVAFRPMPGSRLLSPQPIFDHLTARGHSVEGEYLLIAGWPVQFLPPTGSLVEEAVLQASEVDVEGEPVRVISSEHLAAIALETGRAKDHARLVQFVESGAVDPDCLQAILRRHGLVDKWRNFETRLLGQRP